MLRIIAFSIAIAIAIGGGIVSPFVALVGYVWFALFRPQEWVWTDISAFRFSFVLGILLLVRSAFAGLLPNVTHRHSWAIIGVAFAAVVAHQGALKPDISSAWLEFFLRLAIVTLLLISLANSESRLYWLVLTMALSFGFHTAKAGLASVIGGGVQFYTGLGGAFIDNNSYAIGGVITMPLLWASGILMPPEWRFRRLLSMGAFLAIPLTALFVVSTFSRSGFLALAGGLLTWIALQRRRVTWLVVIVLVGLLGISVAPLPKGYFDRVETIQTYQEVDDTSAISRLHFWGVALSMAADHPLGVGLFNFEANYDAYDPSHGFYGENRAVHNSHLQMLTETGFIGFALWVFLFGSSFVACFRVRRLVGRLPADSPQRKFYITMSTALIASMSAFVVGGTFISMGLNDITWLMFGLVASLELVAQRTFGSPVTDKETVTR